MYTLVLFIAPRASVSLSEPTHMPMSFYENYEKCLESYCINTERIIGYSVVACEMKTATFSVVWCVCIVYLM